MSLSSSRSPRVALISDSYYELNGIGTLCREFRAFAQRRNIPFCCVHSGPKTAVSQEGSVTTIELKRGFTFPLDKGLYCDPFLLRYRNYLIRQLKTFRPDLIHITGPGDMGILGFWVSNILNVPMVASWHTNLHEYLSRRIGKMLGFAPVGVRKSAASRAETYSLHALIAFYRLAHFVLAPNRHMVDLLGERTGRPAYCMKHGVDPERFCPRTRAQNEQFCIGWVGRLTPEKNVRAFVDLERQLLAAGEDKFRLLMVGDGSEREWLSRQLRCATFPGVLEGNELADAFASMDAFVFPSRTDTFGLVILEAMAAGVPIVVGTEAATNVGIRDGINGLVSDNFINGVLSLMRDDRLRAGIGAAGREYAWAHSWSNVFDDVYQTYAVALERPEVRRRMKIPAEVSI